jgi:hypothetical protein
MKDNHLKSFLETLSAFNEKEATKLDLEDSSLSLINSDEFEKLDSHIQSLIYNIDMNELEKLDSDKYLSIEEQLKAFMTTKQQRD